MGGNLSPQQWLRAGLLAGAFVLTLISVFTPWWTIALDVNNSSSDSSARPYAAGDFADDDTEGLTAETILTGVFITIALLGVTGYLATQLAPIGGKTVPPLYPMVCAGVAVAFGLVAVIFTATAWPAGVNAGGSNMGFFDSQHSESQGFSGFGVNTGSTVVDITTYAGFGWYLAIVGSILLPAGAFVHGFLRPAPEAASGAPGAPRLAEPVMSPAPPLRTAKLIEARTVTTRPDSRKK